MDEEEARLASLRLTIDLIQGGKLMPKTVGDIVEISKCFSNYVLDVEEDDADEDEEEQPKKSHGADLMQLSTHA